MTHAIPPLAPPLRRGAQAAPDGPRLTFGAHGELTKDTIRDADLTKAERRRAYQMLEVQKAFLELLDTMSYPVDPDGHTHDINHMQVTNIAIAWTLALAGFRKSGNAYIKKRHYRNKAGLYQNAHTWVDARAPEDAAEELTPGMRSTDANLPPDTRRLAAERDGIAAPPPPPGWSIKPEVIYESAPRPPEEGVK